MFRAMHAEGVMRQQHTVIGGGGLRLNVMEWGNADGLPVLFIHGWSQSYMTWLPQVESDLANHLRLVALDLRGHGMSEAPAHQAAYTDSGLWADDVRAVIDALGLVSPLLVGWSYGGLVISDYLGAYGDEDIAGINFVCATVKLDASVMGTLIGPGFYEHFADMTSPDLECSVDAMRRFVDTCFNVKLSRRDYERALCTNMAVRPDVRASLGAREVDGTAALAALKRPALVSQGRLDTIVLPAMADYILDHCPTATASWYEDIAHGPFIEDSARFNRELAAFAERCAGSAS